jgi:hypothetical protein
MRHDGQDVPVLAARARSGDAESWRREAGGWERRARSMRAVWNILTAASVKECAEETC